MNPASKSEAFAIWAANRRGGSIAELKHCLHWLAGYSSRDVSIWRVINGLENLGYIKCDYVKSTWEAIGMQLVVIPGEDGLAVLTGCYNRRHVSDSEENHGLWRTLVPASTDTWLAELLPATVYVESPTIQGYKDFHSDVQCGFLNVEKELLALRNSDDISLKSAGSPPRLDSLSLERFDFSVLSYSLCGDFLEDGLFRQRVNGRLKYWIRQGDLWYETERGTGPWIWKHISDDTFEGGPLVRHDNKRESLYFHRQIPLPKYLEQLLTMCTGILPVVDARQVRYDNVSRTILCAVSEYLHIAPVKG